jgi:hypothetical protein
VGGGRFRTVCSARNLPQLQWYFNEIGVRSFIPMGAPLKPLQVFFDFPSIPRKWRFAVSLQNCSISVHVSNLEIELKNQSWSREFLAGNLTGHIMGGRVPPSAR